MANRAGALFILTTVFAPSMVNAVPIGDYPGLQKLIDSADAIVVLRIDRSSGDFGNPTLYSTHECYIYQTLKGDIPERTQMELRLMDTNLNFVTPYSHGSTHLMFLMKRAVPAEPTEYRTLTYRGAHVLLSPLGQEEEPHGNSVQEQVTQLIEDSIDYQAREHEAGQRFLMMILRSRAAAAARERTRGGKEEHVEQTEKASTQSQPATRPSRSSDAAQPDSMLLSLKARLECELQDLEPGPTFAFPESSGGQSLIVRFRTRNYVIHAEHKGGRLSEKTVSREGPSDTGFMLTAHSQPLGSTNQARTPQIIRQPYWDVYLNVYPLQRDHKQVYFCLAYRGWTDKALIEKLKTIVHQWSLENGKSKDDR